MLHTKEISIIHDLIDYINTQNQGKTTRTIYYIDIFASHFTDTKIVEAIIHQFRSNE
jgi:hypothetical protein